MFRRHSIVRTVLFSVSMIAVAGCTHEPAGPKAAVSDRPGPKQSFEEIVKLFENGMELPGSNLGGVLSQDTGTSSRFQVHNTVTSQLIPPANPNESYRGTITVSSQSIYSLRHTSEDKDESEDKHRNNAGNNSFDAGGDEGAEFQSFDQGLIANAQDDEKESHSSDTQAVHRRPEKDDRTYELLYRNGRWELVTKLDPKTEASVANAFDRALRRQP